MKIYNAGNVPLAMAVFLASDSYDHNDDPNTISASTLIKPLRQIILPTRLPPSQTITDVVNLVKSRIGTAIHDGIERAWVHNRENAMRALGYPQHVIERVIVNPTPEQLTPDVIPIYMEQRRDRKLGKWTITGKYDFVGEGRVQDFKSTSTYTYVHQTNNAKYIQQGSIYRWISPDIITQNSMDIHFIFTDWNAMKARQDVAYPPAAVHPQTFELITVAGTEQFISQKLALIDKYWEAEEADMPPCTDEELWRSDPVFKYYKNPLSTGRSTKNFDNAHDAYIRLGEDKNVGIVKEVPGQVTACKYCAAFSICTQKDALIASGDLIL